MCILCYICGIYLHLFQTNVLLLSRLLLLRICQYVFIFRSNQSSSDLPCSLLLCDMNMKWHRSTCSAERGNIQYCVSIFFCYFPFPRRQVYYGKLSVRRLKGCVWLLGFGFSLWGFPRPRCTQIHTNCMVAPCSMPCLFNYSDFFFVLLPHPLFSINVLFRLTRKCCVSFPHATFEQSFRIMGRLVQCWFTFIQPR